MTKKELIKKIQSELTSIYSANDLVTICSMVNQNLSVDAIIDVLNEADDTYFNDAIEIDNENAEFRFKNMTVEFVSVNLSLNKHIFADLLKNLFTIPDREEAISEWLGTLDDVKILTLLDTTTFKMEKIPGFVSKARLIEIINLLPEELCGNQIDEKMVDLICEFYDDDGVLEFSASSAVVGLDEYNTLVLEDICVSVSPDISYLREELERSLVLNSIDGNQYGSQWVNENHDF